MHGYLSIFGLSFAVALSGALMPGPLLATVIAESTGGGFWTGPLISLGHALLEAGLLLLIVGGLAGFLTSSWMLAAITAAGSAFLLYSGMKMLSSLKNLAPAQAFRRARPPLRLIAAGVIVSAANPYWIVWWMTVGLGFAISAMRTGIGGVAVFFFGHILADFLWYSTVSFLIAKKRSFISDGAYKAILFCCALTLIGFGMYFLFTIPPSLRK